MTVTLSPKFQIVIPKEIRLQMKLKAGMKLEVLSYDGRIQVLPEDSIKKWRGRFPDLKPFVREPDREL